MYWSPQSSVLTVGLSQSHPLDSLSPSSPRSMKSLLSSSQGSLALCWSNPTLLISVSSQWLLFYKLRGFVVVSSPPLSSLRINSSDLRTGKMRWEFPRRVLCWLSLLWLFSDILDLAPIQRWNPCNFPPWFCLARIRDLVFSRSLSLYGIWEKNIRIL